MRLDDDGFVQDQYASTAKLQTRIAVWQPAAAGSSPQDVAIARLAERAPARLLEVGPGTGAFAERCRAELRCEVVALDSSAEMVRATAARGVDRDRRRRHPAAVRRRRVRLRRRGVDALPRRPTSTRRSASSRASLHPAAGWWRSQTATSTCASCTPRSARQKLESSFSRENGAERLERHFARVERTDLRAQAVFADRAAAAAYLATLGRGDLAERLPEFSEPFDASGAPTVFVADKA